MTQTEGAPHSSLADLVEVMRRLRDPENGCEWDRVQTFETIAPYAIEEAYEVADAIRRGDMADLKEELGDLQLQVVYPASIAKSADRRVGTECVSTGRSRWLPHH